MTSEGPDRSGVTRGADVRRRVKVGVVRKPVILEDTVKKSTLSEYVAIKRKMLELHTRGCSDLQGTPVVSVRDVGVVECAEKVYRSEDIYIELNV